MRCEYACRTVRSEQGVIDVAGRFEPDGCGRGEEGCCVDIVDRRQIAPTENPVYMCGSPETGSIGGP